MKQPEKLLFLPGASGDPYFWQPVASLLSDYPNQTLLGWPGFGVTPPDPAIQGLDDLVTKVKKTIRHPTALLAQSMGGVIAVKLAHALPEYITHLVLTVTSGGIDLSDIPHEDWRPGFFNDTPNVPRWFGDSRDDLSALITTLHLPVLLLWGDADPISPVAVGQRLKQLLPHATLHVIAGGEHDLANVHASQIAPLIAHHLKTESAPFTPLF